MHRERLWIFEVVLGKCPFKSTFSGSVGWIVTPNQPVQAHLLTPRHVGEPLPLTAWYFFSPGVLLLGSFGWRKNWVSLKTHFNPTFKSLIGPCSFHFSSATSFFYLHLVKGICPSGHKFYFCHILPYEQVGSPASSFSSLKWAPSLPTMVRADQMSLGTISTFGLKPQNQVYQLSAK